MSRADAHYFIRPAFEAFFYIPFTWFSYRRASALALIGNLGLLAILVWKLPIWLAAPSALRPALRLALAVFYPFLWSIVLGQDTLLLTLLVGYALSRDVVGGDAGAGVTIGLCAWKPNLTGLLPFGLLAARRWRMAIYSLATSSVLLILSFGLVGVQGFRQWVQLVQAVFRYYSFFNGEYQGTKYTFWPGIRKYRSSADHSVFLHGAAPWLFFG